MRIKRFIAPDMRTALRLVREEQGPDAVILSNRATAEGIEVVAATDYDEALVAQALRAAAPGLDASLTASGRAEASTAASAVTPAPAALPSSGAPHAVPAEVTASNFGNTTPVEVPTRGPVVAAPLQTAAKPEAVGTSQSTAGNPAPAPAPAARNTPKARYNNAAGRDSLMSKAKSIFRRGDAVVDGPTLAELTASVQQDPPTAPPASLPASACTIESAPLPRDSAARFEEMMAALLPSSPVAEVASAASPSSQNPTKSDVQSAKAAAPSPAGLRTATPASLTPTASDDDTGAASADSDADYLIAISTGTAPVGTRDARTAQAEGVVRPASSGTSLHAIATAETDPALLALRRELATMRQLMEKQMDQLSLERLRGSPARAAAFECLLGLGCDTALAQAVAGRLDPRIPPSDIHEPMLAELMRALPIAHGETIEDGGVIALVGPTGAGKTTTAAKLAARFAARHRARDVALVSIDRERTGAREQLHALGRRLGVTVCDAESSDGLTQALEQLADYPLVLVDTAGYGVRDRALLRQILWLRSSSRLRSLLVLPANAHPHDLGEIVRRYRPAAPEGVVLTKLDETGRPGASLSVLAQHGLPLAYACAGQQVPEDLEAADADGLAALFRAQIAEQRANERGAPKSLPASHAALEKTGSAAVNPLAFEDRHAFA